MAQPAEEYDSAAFDLAAPIDRAVEEAEHGKVIYLHRREQRTVAVMPAELAEAALEALEDAEDLEAARAARAEGGDPIPWEQVEAELRDLEEQGR